MRQVIWARPPVSGLTIDGPHAQGLWFATRPSGRVEKYRLVESCSWRKLDDRLTWQPGCSEYPSEWPSKYPPDWCPHCGAAVEEEHTRGEQRG